MSTLTEAFEELAPWITQFEIDGQTYGGWWDGVNNPRLKLFFEKYSVQDKRVLELGPFEGALTIDLCRAGAREVVGVEGRPENVRRANLIKELYGLEQATFNVGDVRSLDPSSYGSFDFVLNSGVLYHLPDPHVLLAKLPSLAPMTLLWTQVADDAQPVNGQVGVLETPYGPFEGKIVPEEVPHPLSGLDDHSFWLYEPELLRLIEACGFKDVDMLKRYEGGPDKAGRSILAVLTT